MASRLIDPKNLIDRAAASDHGVTLTGDLARRQDETARINAQPSRNQLFYYQETIEWALYDVQANIDFSMQQIYAASTTAITLNNGSLDLPSQCRVVALRIASNAAVTAGTCTPLLQAIESGVTTLYAFTECSLSATTPRSKAAIFEWENAVQMAQTATWLLALRTDAGFLPANTLDMKCWLTLAYEPLV